MGPLEIIALIRAGMQAVQAGYDLFEQVKGTLSESDQAKVHQELLDAAAVTNALRPQADAALDEASKV